MRRLGSSLGDLSISEIGESSSRPGSKSSRNREDYRDTDAISDLEDEREV